MGNTPSSQNGSTPGSTRETNNTTAAPTPAQPIPTSQPSSTPTFHSGLTPPPRSPSPPCPSTPALLPYGGHLSPQNPHALSLAQAHDYSKTVVTNLILEARLAPFYRGLEDYEESFTEEDIGRILTDLREKDYEENVANSVVEAMKAERERTVGSVKKKIGIHKSRENRLEEEKLERDKRERRAYLGAIECPICFLVSICSKGKGFDGRIIPRTSIPRDAANNPSAPNVSFRLNGAKRPSLISNQNRPVVRSV